MARAHRKQLFFLFLLLSLPAREHCRSIQSVDPPPDGLPPSVSPGLRTGAPEEPLYRRPLRCLDMVSVEGEFSFTAERPQLSCAAFFVAEPNEVVTLHVDRVEVDCRGGDFVTVFDGWVMKGQTFPSPLDHPLPLNERYVNFCDARAARAAGGVRSSQNVAMIFFRVHEAGGSFTLTLRKHFNPFPCNVLSQSAEGRYTMVVPQQQRNCSFSIVYPVEVDVSDFSLGRFGPPPREREGVGARCADSGDFVQLLGGNSLDTTKLVPITDVCVSHSGPTHVKVGCDNTVVRMVSSGTFVNRVTFSYRPLHSHELQNIRLNNVEDFCFNASD